MKKFVLEFMLEDGDYFLTVKDKKFIIRKVSEVHHVFHHSIVEDNKGTDVLDDDYERQNERAINFYKKLKGEKEWKSEI